MVPKPLAASGTSRYGCAGEAGQLVLLLLQEEGKKDQQGEAVSVKTK